MAVEKYVDSRGRVSYRIRGAKLIYPIYTTSEPKSVSPEEAAKLMARYDKASNQWILDQMKIKASRFIDIN